MFHENVLFGVVQNLLAFPGWRGETAEGLELSYRMLDDPFFGMVELGWIANPEYRRLVCERAASSGKEITYGCGPVIFAEGLSINSADAALRDKSLARLRGLADDAVEFGAKILLLASGPNEEEVGAREGALEILADSLIGLCEYCRCLRPEAPLVVALELFDTEIDKKLLIGDTSTAVEIAAAISQDVPNFSLSLDLSHLPLMGEPMESAVPMAIAHLKHVHIGNCVLKDKSHPRYGDKHPPFGIEGGEIGRAEVQAFFKILENYGYLHSEVPTRKPVVIAELIPAPGEDSLALIQNIKEAVKL